VAAVLIPLAIVAVAQDLPLWLQIVPIAFGSVASGVASLPGVFSPRDRRHATIGIGRLVALACSA
jgi:hypothetical protein